MKRAAAPRITCRVRSQLLHHDVNFGQLALGETDLTGISMHGATHRSHLRLVPDLH